MYAPYLCRQFAAIILVFTWFVMMLPLPVSADEESGCIWDMPMYFQNDYANQRYGSGTVANNGCGITALAMVATSMTGYLYYPDQLAAYFGADASNNIARLELASDALQLPWYRSENFHKTMEAMEDGKIAIVLMNQNSLFTEGQHFIVLKGITGDGKLMVNDPNYQNYSKWDLSPGLASGFDPKAIQLGYDCAWIYDPAAMTQTPAFYQEAGLSKDSRYPDVSLTEQERDLIASVIWVEARGEPFSGQQAIAEVILNRLSCGCFGETVSQVIYGEGQFRSVPYLSEAAPEQAQYEALDAALYGEAVVPDNVFYFSAGANNKSVWGTIGGHVFCFGPDGK